MNVIEEAIAAKDGSFSCPYKYLVGIEFINICWDFGHTICISLYKNCSHGLGLFGLEITTQPPNLQPEYNISLSLRPDNALRTVALILLKLTQIMHWVVISKYKSV